MEQKKVFIPIFENQKWLVETNNNVELVNGIVTVEHKYSQK